MLWAILLIAAYIGAAYFVVTSDSKTVRVLVLVAWAMFALAVGVFAWNIFG